jgi:hypothetical protein
MKSSRRKPTFRYRFLVGSRRQPAYGERFVRRSHRPPYQSAREIEWTSVISTRSDQKLARSSSMYGWACRASSTTSGSGQSNQSTRSTAGSGWATRREDQVMPKRRPNLPLFLLFGPIYFREEIGRWLSIIFHHEVGAHDRRFAEQEFRHRIRDFARRRRKCFLPSETETDTKLAQSRFRRRAKWNPITAFVFTGLPIALHHPHRCGKLGIDRPEYAAVSSRDCLRLQSDACVRHVVVIRSASAWPSVRREWGGRGLGRKP